MKSVFTVGIIVKSLTDATKKFLIINFVLVKLVFKTFKLIDINLTLSVFYIVLGLNIYRA